ERSQRQNGIRRPGGAQPDKSVEPRDNNIAAVRFGETVVLAGDRRKPAAELVLADSAQGTVNIVKGRLSERSARRPRIQLRPFVRDGRWVNCCRTSWFRHRVARGDLRRRLGLFFRLVRFRGRLSFVFNRRIASRFYCWNCRRLTAL